LRDDPDLGNAFAPTWLRSTTAIPPPPGSSTRCFTSRVSRLQTHRLAHWLYLKGPQGLANYLQSRSSAVFQTEINPAARIGRGHLSRPRHRLRCGDDAVIEDDVSILHGVTLGGTARRTRTAIPRSSRRNDRRGRQNPGNIEIGHARGCRSLPWW